jgi:hypothetical protein
MKFNNESLAQCLGFYPVTQSEVNGRSSARCPFSGIEVAGQKNANYFPIAVIRKHS